MNYYLQHVTLQWLDRAQGCPYQVSRFYTALSDIIKI